MNDNNQGQDNFSKNREMRGKSLLSEIDNEGLLGRERGKDQLDFGKCSLFISCGTKEI